MRSARGVRSKIRNTPAPVSGIGVVRRWEGRGAFWSGGSAQQAKNDFRTPEKSEAWVVFGDHLKLGAE